MSNPAVPSASPAPPAFLEGGGEMGALMRAHDWSRSTLGPPGRWPQSLRTVVRLMLNSGHPMYVWWGENGACLYNDAYRASIGPERHPRSLGRPAREVWEEIWPIIGPQIEQVRSGGGATWHVDHLVPITRHGRREDVYWTYSYSPIDDETAPGGIGGVLVVCTETTRQVLTARRLAIERDQFAQLFEQAPNFMAWLGGPEHRFEIANPAYQRLVGSRDLVGRTVAQALPAAAQQGYIELLDRVYASGQAYVASGARYRREADVAAGAEAEPLERYVDFVYQPIKDADGRVVGIFVEGADVSERAHADAALRASDARLRLLDAIGEATRGADDPRAIMRRTNRLLGEHLGVMRCAYADIEPDHDAFTIRDDWTAPGHAPSTGSYALASFGSAAVELLSRGGTLVVHDVKAELAPADGAAAFGALGIAAIVCCALVKGSGLRAMMAVHSASPRRWTEAEVALVEAVAERSWAHLERVRAQALLRANEARLSELIAAVPGFIWTADSAGEFDYVSPRFAAWVGRPVEGFARAHWAEFIHPEDLPTVLQAWQQANAAPASFRIEARWRRHDGAWRWLDVRAEPSVGAGGRAMAWHGYGADRHEQKETADALAASEARHRALAAQLADANRLKDEFLATLAHELRNPLAPMRNALELMQRAPTAPQAAAARDVMQRQLTQMVRLIDDLLDLSRVSRGIVELRRTRLALGAALRDAVETSRPLIEQAGHALVVHPVPEGAAPTVLADPTRIVQVFANLLNNAAKFTPPGGRIELALRRADAGHAEVSVRDNGLGIPPAMLDRVFDMFAQVDRSHAQAGGGLGIGLTLVRRLVEMHGGTVQARSAGPGTGSEFVVRLPLAEAECGVARSAQQPGAAAARPAPLRIVVADDNVDAAQSLALLLQTVGHDTRTAHDGEQAWAAALAFRPQVMVLDIAMPGLDGHALARRVRGQPWGGDVVLIAASGWGQSGDKQLSRDAGFDHHLVKPIDFGALDALLQRHEAAAG